MSDLKGFRYHRICYHSKDCPCGNPALADIKQTFLTGPRVVRCFALKGY